MEAKGYGLQSAQRSARAVLMLNEPENKAHLEDLLNGKINFALAAMFVHAPGRTAVAPNSAPLGPGAIAEAARRDDETAREYMRIVLNIVRRHHKNWGIREFLNWVSEISLRMLNSTRHKQTKNTAPTE